MAEKVKSYAQMQINERRIPVVTFATILRMI
jgi:hypothetical protein